MVGSHYSAWVKNEASEGRDRHILVPVLIDDVKIPFEFRRIQAARLINWDGRASDPEFDLLVKSVDRIIGPKKVEGEGKPSETTAHRPSGELPAAEPVGRPPIAKPSSRVEGISHAGSAPSEAWSAAGDLPRLLSAYVYFSVDSSLGLTPIPLFVLTG